MRKDWRFNDPIQTGAGMVTLGSRIRVKPEALGRKSSEPIEVRVTAIWPDYIRTDQIVECQVGGPVGISVYPTDVVEILEDGPGERSESWAT